MSVCGPEPRTDCEEGVTVLIRKIIAIFLVVTVLLCSCEKSPETSKDSSSATPGASQSAEYGFTLEDFNCNFRVPSDELTIAIADSILDHKMIVNYETVNLETMEPVLPYESFDNFDWDVQFTESPNTFQLYLQCLNPLIYLTKAYQLTSDAAYIDCATEMIQSWIDYEQTRGNSKNPFVWYDHGTALRAENLIYFILVAEPDQRITTEFSRELRELLQEHAEFLSDPQNYTENHNHGIFQDRALIYTAYFLNNDQTAQWLEIAQSRLQAQKEFAFSDEMVHVENSPGYQVGVMDLFRIVADFLKTMGNPYGTDLYQDIEASAEFMAQIVKPNGSLAEIGDTNGRITSSTISNASLTEFGNPHLTYSSTQGLQGEMPDSLSAFYPHSGYYIGRNSWAADGFSDATWTMFKSGYSSKTHKHADDLSFMLYSHGYDVFADTGWYNYVSGNFYRDHFVSSRAHNTLIVDGKSYSPTDENSSKTGILQTASEDGYDYVLGFNEMYPGVSLDRHFYYLGNAILLYDNMVSTDEHTYSQLFQCSEYTEIVESSSTEVLLRLADTGYYVRIRQLHASGPLDFNVYHGDTKTGYGFISRQMNHLEEINTLKFDAVGTDYDLVTLITIEDASGATEGMDKFSFDEKAMTFSWSDGEANRQISLTSRQRVDPMAVSVSQQDNLFTFTNQNTIDGLQYAWYILDRNTAKVLFKTDYSTDPQLSYRFDEAGNYLVKAYVRSSNGHRRSAITSAVDVNPEGIAKDVTNAYPYLNLQYNGQKMEPLSDSQYRFIIDYDYSWTSSVLWYVYRNGGYYDSLRTDNGILDYTFTEPGQYTVMYYLTTANGDNEFWNFSEIQIPSKS